MKKWLLSILFAASVIPARVACGAGSNDTNGVIGDVAGNFAGLLDGAWQDVGLFGLGFVLRILGGGLLWLFLGGLAGLILFWILRWLKLIELPFAWYGYIRWLWAPLCVICLGIGAGWGGLWRGGERSIEKAVVEDEVLRRVVANVYTATAMDGAGYEARGDETAEEIVALIEQSPMLMAEAREDLGESIEAMYEKQLSERDLSLWQRTLLRSVARSGLEDRLLGEYADNAKVLASTLYLYARDPEAYEKYLEENPGLAPMGIAIGSAVNAAEVESMRWIKGVTKVNVVTGWAIGAGIPLGLVGMFKLLVLLAGKGRDVVVDTVARFDDDEDDPEARMPEARTPEARTPEGRIPGVAEPDAG